MNFNFPLKFSNIHLLKIAYALIPGIKKINAIKVLFKNSLVVLFRFRGILWSFYLTSVNFLLSTISDKTDKRNSRKLDMQVIFTVHVLYNLHIIRYDLRGARDDEETYPPPR